MQDFKIQKIQKALKGIRKNDDKDHELTIKNELEKKSKTDSPIKYLKPKEINHSKSRSFNGNFDENEELSENTSKQTTILPPVLKKAPTIQSALIKPILINSSNSDMKKRNKEELKIEDERSKLKEDMYVFLYGRSYQKEEKK